MMHLLQTFLDDQTMCGYGTADEHPALMVEVTQDHLHTVPDLSEGV